MLDLLLTNCPDRVQKVEVVENLSGGDHDAVDFLVEVGRQVAQRSKSKVYNLNLGTSWLQSHGTAAQEGVLMRTG